MALEDFASTNLLNNAGSLGLDVITTVINFIVTIGGVVIILLVFWFIMKIFRYNIDVELWETTGDGRDLQYFGDDKAKKGTKKGVAYINFLKNKDDMFKHRPFPDSKFFYKKRVFGKKIKYIINNNELTASKQGVTNPHGLVFNEFPTLAKAEYLFRNKKFAEDYKKTDDRARQTALIIGVGLMGVILFGLFIIWQSNVATAEATKALANAIGQDVASRANTFPAGPG